MERFLKGEVFFGLRTMVRCKAHSTEQARLFVCQTSGGPRGVVRGQELGGAGDEDGDC